MTATESSIARAKGTLASVDKTHKIIYVLTAYVCDLSYPWEVRSADHGFVAKVWRISGHWHIVAGRLRWGQVRRGYKGTTVWVQCITSSQQHATKQFTQRLPYDYPVEHNASDLVNADSLWNSYWYDDHEGELCRQSCLNETSYEKNKKSNYETRSETNNETNSETNRETNSETNNETDNEPTTRPTPMNF